MNGRLAFRVVWWLALVTNVVAGVDSGRFVLFAILLAPSRDLDLVQVLPYLFWSGSHFLAVIALVWGAARR